MSKALWQIHIAVFLWGFTGVLGRAISISAPALVFYRMIFTAIILAGIITYQKKWQKIPTRDMLRVIGIGVLFAIHWVAFYMSIKLSNASIAMICLATASVFTAILHPLVNRIKIAWVELLIGLMAVSGVLIIYFFQPKNLLADGSALKLGVLLGVSAALLSALFTVLNKPLATKYEALNLVFYEMLAGFVFLCILAPFYAQSVSMAELIPVGYDWLWLFCLVYFCTVVGQSLAMKALQHITPFTLTLTVNLEPIYGIILAFIFFKENQELGSGFYVGMAVIFCSLALQASLSRRKRKKIERAVMIGE